MFREHAYVEVLQRLRIYRLEPYGKNAEVDYMIGASLCRTSSRNAAQDRFQFMLDRYRLLPEERKAVRTEMQKCAINSPPTVIQFLSTGQSSGTVGGKDAGMVYTGLEYPNEKEVTFPDLELLSSDYVNVIRNIPTEEYEKRMFDRRDSARGVAYIKHMLQANFADELKWDEKENAVRRGGRQTTVASYVRATAVGPFILASTGGHTQAQLVQIGRELERVAEFYHRQYDMLLPTKLVVVYMVNNQLEMKHLAESIHGIEVSDSAIGYSIAADMSLVGIIPRMRFGTLKHELLHLMVRGNFGDVPPWLEEGLAALYEVSRFRGTTLIGQPNWRGKILQYRWIHRPKIEKLVKMNWVSFDGYLELQDVENNSSDEAHDENGNKIKYDFSHTQDIERSMNHAMARYFILYLQDKNKLLPVYKAFKGVDVDTPTADAATLLNATLKGIDGMNLQQVEKDFEDWFNSSQLGAHGHP